MRSTSRLFVATTALVLASINASAEAIPPGVWMQTSVTGLRGTCADCEITITKMTPHIIQIVSNNQWVGYAQSSGANDNYVGVFEWREGEGGAYEDVVFTTAFAYDGNILTMNARSSAATITVTYRKR